MNHNDRAAANIFGFDGQGALPEVQVDFPVGGGVQIAGHVTPSVFAGVLQVRHPNLQGTTYYNISSRESWRWSEQDLTFLQRSRQLALFENYPFPAESWSEWERGLVWRLWDYVNPYSPVILLNLVCLTSGEISSFPVFVRDIYQDVSDHLAGTLGHGRLLHWWREDRVYDVNACMQRDRDRHNRFEAERDAERRRAALVAEDPWAPDPVELPHA